jgi:hypothetical protein
MLSPNRVRMLAQHGLWSRLVDEVLRNGRPVPVSIRLRLAEEGAEAATALGLSLARLCELARPGESAIGEVVERLIAMQLEDGSFGSEVATACALAGLLGACEVAGFGAMPGWFTAWPAACGAGARLAEDLHSADQMVRTITAWALAARSEAALGVGLDIPALVSGLERRGVGHDRVLGPMLARARGVIGAAPAIAA